MPAPSDYTYSAAAKVAAHTAFRDLVDVGAGLPYIRIKSAADVTLAVFNLADPCGTVNGTTGQLTLAGLTGAITAPAAAATGTAAYGELCDTAGTVHLAMPCVQGAAPVSGRFVLQNLTIVAGAPVEIISATIG